MQPVDAVALYLQVAASSTATTYIITPQYSNNNIDWYTVGSQGTAAATGVVTVATSTSFNWSPQTTATSTMVLNLPTVPTLHERVLISSSGAGGYFYAEADLKQNPNNP